MKNLVSKFARIAVVALIALPVAFTGTCLADSTPTKTMETIIQSIKSAGNPSGVVEFVNWTKAFDKLPEAQRAQLKITNAEGMKAFFKDMLTSPSATMKKQMDDRLKTVPADKQAQAKEQLLKLEKMMQDKEAEMKDRIAQTEYKVSDEKIEGANATVTLTQTYKGETKTEVVKLEKDGDKWLLPALDSLGNGGQQGAPQGAAPAAPGAAPAAPAAPAPAGK